MSTGKSAIKDKWKFINGSCGDINVIINKFLILVILFIAMGKAFDGKLELDIKIIPYRGDDSWISKTIE